MFYPEKSGTICGTIGGLWNGVVPLERSAVPLRNDLERFRATIGNSTEKSGTIFEASWNAPIPVPLPRLLRSRGEDGTQNDTLNGASK